VINAGAASAPHYVFCRGGGVSIARVDVFLCARRGGDDGRNVQGAEEREPRERERERCITGRGRNVQLDGGRRRPTAVDKTRRRRRRRLKRGFVLRCRLTDVVAARAGGATVAYMTDGCRPHCTRAINCHHRMTATQPGGRVVYIGTAVCTGNASTARQQQCPA